MVCCPTKPVFHVCLYRDMFERFLLSLKTNLQLLLSVSEVHIFFPTVGVFVVPTVHVAKV